MSLCYIKFKIICNFYSHAKVSKDLANLINKDLKIVTLLQSIIYISLKKNVNLSLILSNIVLIKFG